MSKKRKRHNPKQIVKKLRDADAMINAGKELAVVLQSLEVSEATYHRWQATRPPSRGEEAGLARGSRAPGKFSLEGGR